MKKKFEISDSKKYGVMLQINDVEQGDEFEDFLNEECYIFSEIELKPNAVIFYFGEASCPEKIQNLIERFLDRAGKE